MALVLEGQLQEGIRELDTVQNYTEVVSRVDILFIILKHVEFMCKNHAMLMSGPAGLAAGADLRPQAVRHGGQGGRHRPRHQAQGGEEAGGRSGVATCNMVIRAI